MKIETIEFLIESLNNGSASDYIFLSDLHPNVKSAKVWMNLPGLENSFDKGKPSNFYFIRNDENKYIGAVYDMGWDLHWYIKPEHRNRKHLKNALMEVILPNILELRDSDPRCGGFVILR